MRRRAKAGLKVGVVLAAAVASLGQVRWAGAAGVGGGDLVALRVGDGVTAPNASASAIALLDYAVTYTGAAPTGLTLLQTFNAPTSDSYPTTHAMGQVGTATIEGGLSLSMDGQFMTFVGYNSSPGGQTNQTTAAEGGVIGLLKLSDGSIDSSTNVSRTHNTNGWRGAFTTNGNDMWVATGATASGIRPWDPAALPCRLARRTPTFAGYTFIRRRAIHSFIRLRRLSP